MKNSRRRSPTERASLIRAAIERRNGSHQPVRTKNAIQYMFGGINNTTLSIYVGGKLIRKISGIPGPNDRRTFRTREYNDDGRATANGGKTSTRADVALYKKLEKRR